MAKVNYQSNIHNTKVPAPPGTSRRVNVYKSKNTGGSTNSWSNTAKRMVDDLIPKAKPKAKKPYSGAGGARR